MDEAKFVEKNWSDMVCLSISDPYHIGSKGGSRTAATSKMECFVIIVNGWKPLTIITKHSILDVAAALDPPLGRMQTITGISSYK